VGWLPQVAFTIRRRLSLQPLAHCELGSPRVYVYFIDIRDVLSAEPWYTVLSLGADGDIMGGETL
jgi:hypothetical protein